MNENVEILNRVSYTELNCLGYNTSLSDLDKIVQIHEILDTQSEVHPNVISRNPTANETFLEWIRINVFEKNTLMFTKEELEIIRFYYVQNMTQEQIASILDLKLHTVKLQLKKIVGIMRDFDGMFFRMVQKEYENEL